MNTSKQRQKTMRRANAILIAGLMGGAAFVPSAHAQVNTTCDESTPLFNLHLPGSASVTASGVVVLRNGGTDDGRGLVSGISYLSQGANGKGGANGGVFGHGHDGDAGSPAARVLAISCGIVTTRMPNVHGLSIESRGGNGGNGGNGGYFDERVGSGASGADGGQVIVRTNPLSQIDTHGSGAHGIHAYSVGGAGGIGGDGSLFTGGGRGAIGGNGGDIIVDNGVQTASSTQISTIRTFGSGSHGIHARTEGGYGGRGGDGAIIVGGGGGSGGSAGNAGSDIQVTNGSNVYTYGQKSAGMLLETIGGQGGSGGNQSSYFVALGASGGVGGRAGRIDVSNTGAIATYGHDAAGISAKSVGGGGGNGGDAFNVGAFGGVAVGGSGGGGGFAGGIAIDNMADISTSGQGSNAVNAMSIGGGGGDGGRALGVTLGVGVAVQVSLGGSGGNGGDASEVKFHQGRDGRDHLLRTGWDDRFVPVPGVDQFAGDQADVVLLQSIGGGGGSGGRAISVAVSGNEGPAFAVAVGIGGRGGNGGNGGNVTATLDAGNRLQSTGRNASGVVSQSIGGGGGHGGNVITVAAAVGTGSGSIGVGVGGSGGNGGHAGDVITISAADVTTLSDMSSGLVNRSTGGGGGHGGNVIDVAASLSKYAGSVNVGIGGSGGGGGNGAVSSLSSRGSVYTQGHLSHGLFSQSVGGGGGSGGNVHTYAVAVSVGGGSNGIAGAANVDIGGKGGHGNVGGRASLNQNGGVTTLGDSSHGALVQSIGGGGGDGGNVFGLSIAASLDKIGQKGQTQGGRTISGTVAIGGNGGSAGSGGEAHYSGLRNARIDTYGTRSSGVVAQSIGGGGGTGGNSHSFAAASGIPIDRTRLATAKNDLLDKVGLGSKGPEAETKSGLTASVAVGGSAGDGNLGGLVDVRLDQSMTILTNGAQSYGVMAQSLGGSGGSGGYGFSDGFAGVDSFAISLGIGGKGGRGGHGGRVTMENTGDPGSGSIRTLADGSHGILAQSVGGGGGEGGYAHDRLESAPLLAKKAVSINIGGSGGASGNGGTVIVEYHQQISTMGVLAHAIMAQSIGGGGGSGGGTLGDGMIQLGVGGSGGASGTGGTVQIYGQGPVTTSGSGSHGVFAQSIGGGGGAGGVAGGGTGSIRDFGLKLHLGGKGATAAHGGEVLVSRGGSITTRGDAAFGILAQSVGGGGGLNAAVDFTAGISNNQIETDLTASDGNGGNVTVTGRDAPLSISTSGRAAHGVFAQSIGGGGGLAIVPIAPGQDVKREISRATSTGGDVVVSRIASIRTTGDDAHGIRAESLSSATTFVSTTEKSRTFGLDQYTTGRITIDQAAESRIDTSGARSHGIVASNANRTVAGANALSLGGYVNNDGRDSWGVLVTNGEGVVDSNPLVTTVVDVKASSQIRSSSISSGGIRIDDVFGASSVTVAGAVLAKGATAIETTGRMTLNIASTGIVQGRILSQSRGSSIVSSGNVYGSIGTEAHRIGTYVLNEGARHWLAIDPQNKAGGTDRIAVDGIDLKGGRIVPYLVSLPTGSFSFQDVVLGGYQGGVDSLFEQKGLSTLFEFERQGDRTGLKNVTIDFSRAGLEGNDATLAQLGTDLVGSWSRTIAGGQRSDLEYYLLLAANAPTKGELSSLLEHLDATEHFSTVDAAMLSATSHLDNMQSCGTARGPNAAIRESECSWAKVVFGDVERRGGLHRHGTTTYALGQQREVARGIFVGLNAAYEDNDSRSPTATSNGHRIHLGAIGKLSRGPLLASLSTVFSRGVADGSRQVALNGSTAVSRHRTDAVSTRLRTMYLHEMGPVDLFPILEVDMALVRDEGYSETGAGPFDLKVHGRTHFLADVHPALRVGGEADLGKAVLRSYLEGGARFALNDPSTRISFANSPFSAGQGELVHGRDRAVATLATGASLNTDGRIEISARYEAGFGAETLSHTASVKAGLRF